MLKHALLASAILITTPVLAQNQPQTTVPQPDVNASPAQPQTAPVPQAPTATAPAPQTTPAPTSAAPTAPAAPATANTQPQAAPAPAAPAPNAQAANPAPANPGAQVADVVNGEFGTYDKNKDGSLSKAEFGAWMTALRTKADPSVKDDAANKSWIAKAFTQADSDKSNSISKDELTNFLSQGSGQKAS